MKRLITWLKATDIQPEIRSIEQEGRWLILLIIFGTCTSLALITYAFTL